MAFINDYLTKEESVAFEAKEIPNPGNILITLKPTQWTINREEEVYLVWGLQEREEPHDYHFMLFWKGELIPVKLNDRWDKSPTRIWDLLDIKIPDNLKDKQSDIIQSLRDALTVYAFNGSPAQPLNKTTKVHCNF